MPCSILFVCLGNICRSPAAEAVMRKLVADRGVNDRYLLDSAGTGNWHVGDLSDARMRRAGAARGYEFTHRARQVKAPADFEGFDLLLAMDDSNYEDLVALAGDEGQRAKVVRMTDYCRWHGEKEVPDPYYGGPDGFDKVLDILEDACENLLAGLEMEGKEG